MKPPPIPPPLPQSAQAKPPHRKKSKVWIITCIVIGLFALSIIGTSLSDVSSSPAVDATNDLIANSNTNYQSPNLSSESAAIFNWVNSSIGFRGIEVVGVNESGNVVDVVAAKKTKIDPVVLCFRFEITDRPILQDIYIASIGSAKVEQWASFSRNNPWGSMGGLALNNFDRLFDFALKLNEYDRRWNESSEPAKPTRKEVDPELERFLRLFGTEHNQD